MDVLERLEIETNGICEIINRYTSEAYISSILKQFKIAVGLMDIKKILYLLVKIDNWYSKNLIKIKQNELVSNYDSHVEIVKIIKDFIRELSEFDQHNSNVELLRKLIHENIMDKESEKMSKKIFISHSSKDKIICTAFVNLLEALGLKEEVILYSSSSRHGIPGDSNIFDYLRKHLSEGITVYYMLSDNYYQSAYCLNEMGAAWIVQNNFSIFTLPNFSVGFKGVIDSNKKAFDLKEPMDLIDIKDKINKDFKLDEISAKKWEEEKMKFLDKIEEFSKQTSII